MSANPRNPDELAGADLSRRRFIVTAATAAAGLVIGFSLTPKRAFGDDSKPPAGDFAPNAFLRIAPDGTITVLHGRTEMGQGVHTSLPMLVAEELEADWKTVRFAETPTGAAYNSTIADAQFTGGSLSVWTAFDQLRRAGATARVMLVAAAAKKWGVAEAECAAENGKVLHRPSGKAAGYGELAGLAAAMPAPAEVRLKEPSEWKLIGKPTRRLDSFEKASGQAIFGLDYRNPEMFTAVVARSPTFGGKVKSFRAEKALAVPGVKSVHRVDTGVAVVAEETWSAIKGRRALEIEWDAGEHANLSTESIRERYAELAKTEGLTVRKEGDPAGAVAGAARRISAVYVLPFLAHAPMEPLNCYAEVRDGKCYVVSGTQMQTGDVKAAAEVAGIGKENVELRTLFAGGGFGRRANPAADFTREAVEVAKAANLPVKVVWTREDDTRGGYYRPFSYNVMEGGVDAAGNPLFWTHRIVGQSILEGTIFESSMTKNGYDSTTVEGAKNLPYEIPNVLVDLHSPKLPVPVLWWRSVGHSINAFTTESFIDELAALAGADPVAYRMKLLGNHPRWRKVLEVAAEKAGWGTALKTGRARGVAVHESFGSFVAQVAEVSVEKNEVVVHKVTCAVDCGHFVNPLTIEAQMQGGVAYGLSAALHGRITIKDGRVEQGNFNDYRMIPYRRMPKVEVHIVKSGEKPGGIGEPGTPPIAPALANAVAALTGKRIRELPIALG